MPQSKIGFIHARGPGAPSKRCRAKRQRFVEWILTHLPSLPIRRGTARIHAQRSAQLAVQGTGISDSWSAASALEHGQGVAMRNPREFQRVEGLHVEHC